MKELKKKSAIVTVAVAAVVAAVLVLILARHGGREQPSEPSVKNGGAPLLVQKNAAASAVRYPQSSTNAIRRTGTMPGRLVAGGDDGIFRDSDGNPYPPADQKIMMAAATAIEKDDLEMARDIAEKALTSANAELRAAVVDALGWFGELAMAELTPFMSDSDADVADAATAHWKDALQEIEDDGTKAGVVEMSMKALSDKELLEDVANELIGIDELAAVQVIANMIDAGDCPAANVARGVYEDITGETWAGIDAAETWLQENYTLSDDEE